MMHNYSQLKGRIITVFGSNKNFADAMGLSKGAISLKLSGKTEFSMSQIKKAIELLGISNDDIAFYFFDYSDK